MQSSRHAQEDRGNVAHQVAHGVGVVLPQAGRVLVVAEERRLPLAARKGFENAVIDQAAQHAVEGVWLVDACTQIPIGSSASPCMACYAPKLAISHRD